MTNSIILITSAVVLTIYFVALWLVLKGIDWLFETIVIRNKLEEEINSGKKMKEYKKQFKIK